MEVLELIPYTITVVMITLWATSILYEKHKEKERDREEALESKIKNNMSTENRIKYLGAQIDIMELRSDHCPSRFPDPESTPPPPKRPDAAHKPGPIEAELQQKPKRS